MAAMPLAQSFRHQLTDIQYIYMRPKLMIIVAIAGLALVVVVALYMWARQNKNPQLPLGISPTPATIQVGSSPRTIDFPVAPTGATFVYSGPEKVVPTTLPV